MAKDINYVKLNLLDSSNYYIFIRQIKKPMCRSLRFVVSYLLVIGLTYSSPIFAQSGTITGVVAGGSKPLAFSSLTVDNKRSGVVSDSAGNYSITGLTLGTHTIAVSALGYKPEKKTILLTQHDSLVVDFDLKHVDKELKEVVVTGTLKEVTRMESPVPVEIYTPAFFKKNPTPNIFEALQ